MIAKNVKLTKQLHGEMSQSLHEMNHLEKCDRHTRIEWRMCVDWRTICNGILQKRLFSIAFNRRDLIPTKGFNGGWFAIATINSFVKNRMSINPTKNDWEGDPQAPRVSGLWF